jgi:multiple sugar transport system substrate-binding protein
MPELAPSVLRTLSRRTLLAGAAGLGAAPILGSCARPAGGPTPAGSNSLTWANWANPGEAERFREFNTRYQKQVGVQLNYQIVVGDYTQKLLTQVVGKTAPDAFYCNDAVMGQMIKSNLVLNLDEHLSRSETQLDVDKIFPGLMDWCRGFDGEGLYGVPVDCNPRVFWYNKGLLDEAGVTTEPATLQEEGRWDQNALTDLLSQLRKTGKRGLVIEADWADLFAWMTTFGGTTIDDQGRAVFHEDPKALSSLEWIWDQLAEENIAYGGSLPKGQGVDALFYSGQLASVTYGRWILPNLRDLPDLDFDIAPLPSETGDEISSVTVHCASMCINERTNNPELATEFLAAFCNDDGTEFRLSGGGNAVPAMPGLDEIVTEGNLPPHGHWMTEVAARGYTNPVPLVQHPERAVNLGTNMDSLIRQGTDYRTFAQKAAAYINGEA